MAVRFRDIASGEGFEVDSPDDIAAAEADPSVERILRAPAFFKDKEGKVFEIDGARAAADAEASGEATRVTDPDEYARIQRKAIELAGEQAGEEASRQYLKERPLQTGLAAGLASFAKTTLPFGDYLGTKLIKAAGLSEEEQAELEAAAPVSSTIGTGLGFAGSLAALPALGGVSAAGRLAGAGAAARAAAAGSGRLAQSLSAARAAATVPVATVERFAPVMAGVGRAAAATEAGITALAPQLAGTVAGRLATGAAAGVVGTGAYNILRQAPEFVESKIDGREYAGESIASGMGLAAALGGGVSAIGPAMSWVGQTQAGQKWAASLGRSRGERVYKAHAPALLGKTQRQLGPTQPEKVYDLVNEAIDEGLVGQHLNAQEMLDRSRAALRKSGERIGEISSLADERLGAPVNVEPMWQNIIDGVIEQKSMAGSVQSEEVARRLLSQVESFRDPKRFGDRLTLKQLSKMRSELDDIIYGEFVESVKDPTRTSYFNGLRQFRHKMTDQLGEAVLEAGVPKAIWKDAQRAYQVASHAERIGTHAVRRSVNKSPTDVYGVLSTLASIGVGAASGAATGIETKLGLSALKWMAPRGRNWAGAATRRALLAGAPKEMVDDLGALSRQQAETAATARDAVAAKPVADASTEFLGLYDDLLAAPIAGMPSPYRQALNKAKSEMEAAYRDALKSRSTDKGIMFPGGIRPDSLGPVGAADLDVDILGNGLEKARNILAEASIPKNIPLKKELSTVAAQKPFYESMRGLRDKFTVALGNPTAMWGETRAQRAADEFNRLYGIHSDPNQLAKLQAIAEKTSMARRRVSDGAARIMGISIGSSAAATKAKQAAAKWSAIKSARAVAARETEIDDAALAGQEPTEAP